MLKQGGEPEGLVVQMRTFPAPYSEALGMQRECLAHLVEQASQPTEKSLAGYLLMGEHSPVYTLGKFAKAGNVLLQAEDLAARGIALHQTDRGGDVTYHGPGQLVVYPILNILRFGLGPKRYIHLLEETVIQLLAPLGIMGIRDAHAAGVWIAPTAALPLRKICAIGVRFTQGYTMHGLALNVHTDLSYFQGINPCGFIDRGVCSIDSELGHHPSIEAVKTLFAEQFARIFHAEVIE